MEKYRILFAIAILFLAGCMKFEHETPTEREYVKEPEIVFTKVADSSFTFRLTAAQGTGYYSYVVVPGQDIIADSVMVLKTGVPGAISKKTVKASDHSSIEVTVSGLDTYSWFTVASASSSVQGSVGKLVQKTVRTSDSACPEVVQFTSKENAVKIQFSESVSHADGQDVFAVAYPKLYVTGTPVIERTSASSLKVEDDVVTVSFDEIGIPGTWYTVNFPEGTFVDEAGNKCPGLASKFYFDENGNICCDGVFGFLENKALEVKMPAQESIRDCRLWISLDVSTELEGFSEEARLRTIVYHKNGEVSITGEYPMTAGLHYLTGDKVIKVRPSFTPESGDRVSFYIPEGACMDIFGNINEEITVPPMIYSSGYSIADVTGKYTFHSSSAFEEYGYGPYDDIVDIIESDDPEKGDVMFTGSVAGETIVNPVYADFDENTGRLTLDLSPFVFGYENDGQSYDIRLVLTDGIDLYDQPVTLSLTGSHMLEYDRNDCFLALVSYNRADGLPESFYDALYDISVK